MNPSDLEAFARAVYSINTSDPIAGSFADAGNAEMVYEVHDNKAFILITGVIMKSVPAAVRWLGMEATSTLEVSAAIEAAERDPEVGEIVFIIDSPGGTVAGVQQLADQMRNIEKPTTAAVSDMAASAAYWLASQTDEIEANATAMIGSIGVYSVMIDTSAAYAEAGITVQVVRSGQHKGAGVDGVPISADDINEEQRMIDQLSHMFAASVARGRDLTAAQVANLATGQVWLAHDALAYGLIDQIYGPGLPDKKKRKKESMNAQEPHEEPVEGEEPEAEEQDKVEELESRIADLETRVAELEGEVEVESAKAEAAQQALASMRVNRKVEVIQHAVAAGKITPAMKASVETFANACGDNVEQLEAFIAGLPVQTREQPISQAPAGDARGQLSASDARVCEIFGLKQNDFIQNGQWDAVAFNGSKVTKKGGLL